MWGPAKYKNKSIHTCRPVLGPYSRHFGHLLFGSPTPRGLYTGVFGHRGTFAVRISEWRRSKSNVFMDSYMRWLHHSNSNRLQLCLSFFSVSEDGLWLHCSGELPPNWWWDTALVSTASSILEMQSSEEELKLYFTRRSQQVKILIYLETMTELFLELSFLCESFKSFKCIIQKQPVWSGWCWRGPVSFRLWRNDGSVGFWNVLFL